MRAPRIVIGLGAALATAPTACSSEPVHVTPGQVLLYFDTDAPLPVAPGERPSLETALFDRLRVDIYPPGATTPCDGCSSDFSINTGLFETRSASVGVATRRDESGWRARARLFKEDFADPTGEPDADSTIDVTVALPIVDQDAIFERTILLSTDDVGHPVGSLDAPADPVDGSPVESLVGTWPGAERKDCKGTPPAGTICIPGGAYWMGNPNGLGYELTTYVPEPRLVVLAPFFLDSTEVTVERYRAAGYKSAGRWSGSSTGATAEDFCTFTVTPGPFDALPVNCISQVDARTYCTAHGGDLPTEAQFEYAASGLVDDPFPWGRDSPDCSDAIFGRSGWGIFSIATAPCKPASPPGSPAAPATGLRDRLDLLGGSVFDLAGNISEFARDSWNRIDEPCWSRAGVYHDPVCTTPSPNDGPLTVFRGGNWVDAAVAMPAYRRRSYSATERGVQFGFRCAWPSP
jgi:formylglycine-generating enzyme required for sulfatase activity